MHKPALRVKLYPGNVKRFMVHEVTEARASAYLALPRVAISSALHPMCIAFLLSNPYTPGITLYKLDFDDFDMYILHKK